MVLALSLVLGLAGGMMTDWGVHWLDIVQLAMKEEMPMIVTSAGAKFWLKDNRETPDTLRVINEYPETGE